MEKKTKLTLSGIAKKSIESIELAKTQSKNSVVIKKKTNKILNKGSFSKSFSQSQKKTSVFSKDIQSTPKSNDYEKRKLAEQRATRRIRGETNYKDSKKKKGSPILL